MKTRLRRIKRTLKNKKVVLPFVAALLVFVGVSYAEYMSNRRLSVNPGTYQTLLGLIAKVESNGNYNAYFGNARNNKIDFTNMTIAEVRKWQEDYVAEGSPSSAVGRYQIISTTLDGLVKELNVEPNQKFDEKTQDAMAIKLLERRGAEELVNEELTEKEFAANLAMEWAALPKVVGDDPQASYYDGDGLNKSRVEVKKVLEAIEPIEAQ